MDTVYNREISRSNLLCYSWSLRARGRHDRQINDVTQAQDDSLMRSYDSERVVAPCVTFPLRIIWRRPLH
eukprot:scaffold203797_cov23-Cyclotella_meneghiniana.AAC.1